MQNKNKNTKKKEDKSDFLMRAACILIKTSVTSCR